MIGDVLMSGIDEIPFTDFPMCACLEQAEFWYYLSPLNDKKNIFFNPRCHVGSVSKALPIVLYDESFKHGRMCTLEELESIGDGVILSSRCRKEASKEVKDQIMKSARYIINRRMRNVE